MPKPKPAKLSSEQVESVAQFAEYAFDYFSRSFDEVVRKVLLKEFGERPTAKRFRRGAKEVFDRKRES